MNNKPNKFMIIGLTGSIGSGKSLVASYFKELGIPIIDADKLSRKAVEPGSTIVPKIKEIFGDTIFLSDGSLNRRLLGEIVFSDESKRKQLEDIIHPKIRELYFRELDNLKTKSPIVIYAVPLLFESRFDYKEVGKIIVVYSKKEDCINRVMKRDGLSEEEAIKRFDSQISPEEKVKKADYVIYNIGTEEELKAQVNSIYNKIVALG